MNRNELIEIDKGLVASNKKDSILISKRGFYIYYNEKRDSNLVIIHSHFCGHCEWGKGKRKNKQDGKNGVWVGPFYKIKHARNFCKKHFNDFTIKEDTCVNVQLKYLI